MTEINSGFCHDILFSAIALEKKVVVVIIILMQIWQQEKWCGYIRVRRKECGNITEGKKESIYVAYSNL